MKKNSNYVLYKFVYYVRTYCTNIYTAYFIFIIRAYVVNNICKRVIRHSSDLNFKRGYNNPLNNRKKPLDNNDDFFFAFAALSIVLTMVWIGSDMDGIVQFIIVNVNDKKWRDTIRTKELQPIGGH